MSWLKWLSDIDERLTIHAVKILNRFILCYKNTLSSFNVISGNVLHFASRVLGLASLIEWTDLSLSELFYLIGTVHALTDHFTIVLTIKLAMCLAVLIVIRGCIPRYRYDFLTKIGWVKFLGYVLSFFCAAVVLFLLW